MYRISNEHSDLVADVVSQNLSPFREEILEETVAQKIIALLSRVENIENQPKLVRHIYDIWRIREFGKNQNLMQTIFDFSIIELSQRSKGFCEPVTEFQKLQLALTN